MPTEQQYLCMGGGGGVIGIYKEKLLIHLEDMSKPSHKQLKFIARQRYVGAQQEIRNVGNSELEEAWAKPLDLSRKKNRKNFTSSPVIIFFTCVSSILRNDTFDVPLLYVICLRSHVTREHSGKPFPVLLSKWNSGCVRFHSFRLHFIMLRYGELREWKEQDRQS